jgi:hypothetical protein
MVLYLNIDVVRGVVERSGFYPLETSHGIMVDFDDSSDKSIEGARSKQIRLEPQPHTPLLWRGWGPGSKSNVPEAKSSGLI